MKTVTILAGLPACGKSTWRSKNVSDDVVVISSDDLIEAKAAEQGKTYDEVFQDHIKWSDRQAKQIYVDCLNEGGRDIVVDRTNLTPKVRKYWIDLAKAAGFRVNLIWFKQPIGNYELGVWSNRLNSRKGKTIPWHVLDNMRDTLCTPTSTMDENLDHISFYNSFDLSSVEVLGR